MKLLTVILNYKTADMTIQSADAALKALRNIDSDWQLTIVDNDSRDGSLEKLQAMVEERSSTESEQGWSNVDVVDSGHNGGFGAGNNYAINKAINSDSPPDYIYMLNSDAFPAPDAIQCLVDHLDNHPQTGIAGSYIHGTDGQPHVTAFRFPSIFSEFEGAIRFGPITKLLKNHVVPMGIPESNQEIDWLAGASMMIRSKVLQSIGVFDETFFLYFEETDLCKRARNHGWKTVYIKESAVAHIGSVSTGMKTWDRIPYYWLDSRKHYFQKNHSKAYYICATLLRLLGGLLWKLRSAIQNKKDTDPKYFLSDLAKHMFGR